MKEAPQSRAESLSKIVDRHRLRWAHRGTSMATIAAEVRAAWERRYPNDRSIEWSQDSDLAQRMEMDAQRLSRHMPGGTQRFPLDLLPCWRDAFPPDLRAAFDDDLASELGVMFAPPVAAGAQSAQLLGPKLMQEAAGAIREYLVLLADGKVSPDERRQLELTLREARELHGVTVAIIATLEGLQV